MPRCPPAGPGKRGSAETRWAMVSTASMYAMPFWPRAHPFGRGRSSGKRPNCLIEPSSPPVPSLSPGHRLPQNAGSATLCQGPIVWLVTVPAPAPVSGLIRSRSVGDWRATWDENEAHPARGRAACLVEACSHERSAVSMLCRHVCRPRSPPAHEGRSNPRLTRRAGHGPGVIVG